MPATDANLAARRAVTALLATVALTGLATLTGCSGGGAASPSATSSSLSSSGASSASSRASSPGATPSSASPSVTPSPSSSPSASRSAPAASGPVRRNATELKAALLEISDLPTGFSAEKSSQGNDGSGLVSSKAGCRALVTLLNTERPPGSTAAADATFSGGADGPVITESLDAMGTPAAASALIARLSAAVKTCPKATLRLAGQGSSPLTITPVSAPRVGSQAYAVRQTAVGGALDGLEVTQVVVRSGDVLVTMTFLGAVSDDVDGATTLAVEKVASALDLGSTA